MLKPENIMTHTENSPLSKSQLPSLETDISWNSRYEDKTSSPGLTWATWQGGLGCGWAVSAGNTHPMIFFCLGSYID